ncbi:MAG: xanthine dehydrogenase family protein molybdopterin-binding subunit [Acidobacteria bacterium]|nr:xanthine dehydrogenase family protein molybdopterin-binding subunit [Acidobacteriota bacterium]
MWEDDFESASFEPERYELYEGPAYRFDLDRRDFFKVVGGGIVVVLALPEAQALQESGGGRPAASSRQSPSDLAAWLHIGEDGVVTVYTGKVEVGQNIRTSLAQVVAEELHVSVSSIRMVMGDTDLTPYDRGTYGSRTTYQMSPQLRKVGATARELLIGLAAKQWGADRSSLAVENGKVIHLASNRSADFGQLTQGQKLVQEIGEQAPVISPEQWKTAGKTVPKVGARNIVTGKHKYTSDMRRPGMLYGKVLRPAAFNSTLESWDGQEAKKMSGVSVVRDGNFIGVAAPSEEMATRAVASIQAKWSAPQQISRSELFDYLRNNPWDGAQYAGRALPPRGSMEAGLAEADHKIERTYTVAYIQHVPLEPRAAVAEWNGGKLTVWTGTQRPFGVRSELAQAFRIPETRVRVIMPDTGSGYGGKHTGETAIEAARLARAAGKPVKLVWTREEEFTWAYFRPAGVIEVSSGLRRDGKVTSWDFHNYNSGPGGFRVLYDIPNQRIEFHGTRYPLRQGSYRSLAAAANHFARETHMDEMAHTVKMDPLEFRLHNLKDPRLRAVLEAAAERFGWSKPKPSAEVGWGIAGGFDKGGYIATCAEVVIDRSSGRSNSDVKITRVVSAFDCGPIINPDHLKNQIEGANIMGIGGALFEAIDFENGKILNPRLSQYRVPRFSDVPVLETVLIDRKDQPTAGAGETPIVGMAPSVGNAIFDATGVRLRSLPLAPNGLQRDRV